MLYKLRVMLESSSLHFTHSLATVVTNKFLYVKSIKIHTPSFKGEFKENNQILIKFMFITYKVTVTDKKRKKENRNRVKMKKMNIQNSCASEEKFSAIYFVTESINRKLTLSRLNSTSVSINVHRFRHSYELFYGVTSSNFRQLINPVASLPLSHSSSIAS